MNKFLSMPRTTSGTILTNRRLSIWLLSSPETSNVKLFRESTPWDKKLYAYLIQAKMLNLCLFVTSLFSIILFGFALTLRHQTLSHVYDFLKDDIARIKEQEKTLFAESNVARLMTGKDREDSNSEFYGWARMLTDLILTAVMLIWACTISGILTAFEKNKVFVMFFAVSNIVCIGTEISVASVFLTNNEPMHQGLQAKMIKVVKTKYQEGADSSLARIFDTFMIAGKCCGVKGPEDFQKRVLKFDNNVTTTLHFPASCCKMEAWTIRLPKHPNILKCVTSDHRSNEMYHRTGCFQTWTHRVIEANFNLVVGLTSTLCLFQLFQFFIAVVLMVWVAYSVKLDGEDYKARSSSAANSQLWGTGLRVTTLSELMMSKEKPRTSDSTVFTEVTDTRGRV